MKFHVNPGNGAISRCRAEQGGCPFGGDSGEENHYESIKEARAGYEEMMADRTHKSLSKQGALAEFASSDTPQAKAYREVNAKFEESYVKWEEFDEYMKKAAKNNKDYKNSDQWFNDVQNRKAMYFEQLKLHGERRALLPQEIREQEEAEDLAEEAKAKANRDAWFAEQNAKGPYEYHPEITEANQWKPATTIATFTGRTKADVQGQAQGLVDGGMSRTEAYRKIWAEAEMRTDKPMIALDLEASAPMIKGRVDTGSYSTIIEFGYVKRYPDGTMESKSFLCGLPDNVRDTIGTGAEHIHNISPEMVADKKPFQEDDARIREFVKDIDGSVIIAHNASYEKSQLSHAIYRFGQHEKSGRVQMFDTREVSQWFMPGNENNSNESFTTNNGVEYEGAHRALADAQMSLAALFNSKGISSEGIID